MRKIPPALLQHLHQIARSLPEPVLTPLVDRFLGLGDQPGAIILPSEVLSGVPTSEYRKLIKNLIDVWVGEAGGFTSESLGLALSATADSIRAEREELKMMPVWTGPASETVPMRRTDQVLLQMISEAERELLIVSFAVYAIPEIVVELEKALNRGVLLRMVVETPESSEGEIAFGFQQALENQILNQAEILVWPREKRPTDDFGRHGSLHAKCAVSDRKRTFISSANLTGYALSLNMEMGLLVENADLATRIWSHFENLVNRRILVEFLKTE